MDLGGAGLAEHADQGALGVAAHDGVVDDDQALALDDFLQRVQLQADSELPDRLRGLDERTADVGVLHQARAEGDAGGLRVADGGRGAGFRGRYDQVGLDRGFLRELAAHLHAGEVHIAAGDVGVRAGQVHVLEDTALGLRFRESRGAQPVLVDGDELARLDLAHVARTADVQGSGLRGDDPAALQPPEDQRADALRVTGGVEGVLVHEDQREGALDLRKDLVGGFLDGQRLAVLVHLGREQRGQQVGVVGRRHTRGAALLLGQVGDHLGELGGVDEVAVVAERDRAVRGGTERRLGVLPHGGTGGRVAGVTDRDMTLERTERGLVEDLGHQAHVLEDEDLGAVADRDSRGFLAPMLEGVEPEVRELCDLFARSPDTEDATRVLGAFLAGEQIVIESTVTTWHGSECRRDRPLVRIR